MVKRRLLAILTALMISLAGCQASPDPVSFIFAPEASRTPFQPLPTETPVPSPVPTETPTANPATVYVDPAVPAALLAGINFADLPMRTDSPDAATLRLAVQQGDNLVVRWIYALVTPFPELVDNVSLSDLQARWHGASSEAFGAKPLLLAAETLRSFQALWGPPGDGAVQILPANEILDTAWNDRPAWAIVPFEELQSRWKVLQIDGQSPLARDLDETSYPLAVPFGWSGAMASSLPELDLPPSNRDPQKMTVVVMTGVTALVRATAFKMEQYGVIYPARDIRDWLLQADLTHISNEVSFYPDCPYPNMADPSMYFCSSPKNIGLLEDIDVDIIELTGNHNNDVRATYQVDVYPETLEMYRQHGWPYFGGGVNLSEAKTPLRIENHGNKLGFIGCNSFGPNLAWATESSGGAAPCEDFEWIRQQVAALRAEGYLPIVTLQYSEDYSNYAGAQQREDFRSLADAGAVIVQGSQAHTPKEMEFFEGGFVHYGLGNLFFDQMGLAEGVRGVPATEEEFIDRHVFYEGRYLSTELLTARLEDFARPRPMSPAERAAFLQEIFTVSGW